MRLNACRRVFLGSGFALALVSPHAHAQQPTVSPAPNMSTPAPAAQEAAPTSTPTEPSAVQASRVRGEGKTLPHGVLRFRSLYRTAWGDQAFTPTGKREQGGFTLRAEAAAGVLEYGLTPALSLQLVAPVVLQNKLAMDGSVFKNSARYQEKYEEFLGKMAEKLVEGGVCSSAGACRDLIEKSSFSLPTRTVLTLPTGEKIEIKAGIPLRTVASSIVVNAAVPEAGRTGLGDLELGALFAYADPQVGVKKDWPVAVSFGLGVRFPTGSFSDVPTSQRPTGRGATDLGLRVNVDRYFSEAVVFSWQHQMESTLVAGKKKRSSVLTSSALNSADPLSEGADRQPNEASFKRTGLRQIGFLKAIWSASTLAPTLESVLLNGLVRYDFDSPGQVAGVSLGQATQLWMGQVGVTFDGLAVSWPVQFDLDYEIPVSGQALAVSAQVLTATLKLYARF